MLRHVRMIGRLFALVVVGARTAHAQQNAAALHVQFQAAPIAVVGVNDGGVGGGQESFVMVDSASGAISVTGRQVVWTTNTKVQIVATANHAGLAVMTKSGWLVLGAKPVVIVQEIERSVGSYALKYKVQASDSTTRAFVVRYEIVVRE